MAGGLIADRVRGDVDVLARAGLDLDAFLSEAVESVARAVPWEAVCVAMHDPATRIITGARKFGSLHGRNEHDALFARIEYDSDETTTIHQLSAEGRDVVAMHRETGGEVERSERMARLMMPEFGYHDEVRVLYRDGRTLWGAMALFRGEGEAPFSGEDLDFLATLSGSFARGVRAGLLASVAAGAHLDAGPAVVIFDASDRISQLSEGAARRLEQLRFGEGSGDPIASLAALVGAARAVARGETTALPRARVRGVDGMWLVLHASPLAGADGHRGDVVITIEEARPPEIVSLVVSAFDLTQRERDVVQLVIQGVDTKEIAARLHVSSYTVQDHLKSVFDKADVRSRRELIARIYFDQYVPRMGTELGPTGWFADAVESPAG